MIIPGSKNLTTDWQVYHNKCRLERWKQELAQEESGRPLTAKVSKEFRRNAVKMSAYTLDSSTLWRRGEQIDTASGKKAYKERKPNLEQRSGCSLDSSAKWPRGERIDTASTRKVDKVWERCGLINGQI